MARHYRVVVVAAALAASAFLPLHAPQVATIHATGDDLLPDLETRPPTDIEVVNVRKGNKVERRLRFDNEVVNRGRGPFELYPKSADCDGDGDVRNDRLAIQRIYQDNGNGYFERGVDKQFRDTYDSSRSCMIFHAAHRHWHFEEFASYALKQLIDGNGVGSAVASSTKVSFCIIDIHRREPSLPGSPANKYYSQCDRNSTLGISVGWSDEYHSTLADQYLPITGIEDGIYCLVSTADPANKLVESSKSNNAAGTKITLSGNTVTPRNATDSTHRCGP